MTLMTSKKSATKTELSMSSCLRLKISMNKTRSSVHPLPQRATTSTGSAPANKAKHHESYSKALNR